MVTHAAAPLTSPIQAYLEALLAELAPNRAGAVADYIPELAAANPEQFGVAIVTVDGTVYCAGDCEVPFTIQSMSKPFTYGLALSDHGLQTVDAHVGVEPTGDAFNSISLEPATGRPRNPMINAGAITATSLVRGDRDARILDLYGRCAGRSLTVDEATYASERATGHRNRAIGQMLRAVTIVDGDPDPIVDAYFRQCSVAVTCVDAARMAATLASGGTHPGTSDAIFDAGVVRRVLSVMTMCGMYDGAGDWMVSVGLPAKSGVAGGVMAVLPGQLGLCVFSPRLDDVGNSVRGVAVCTRIANDLRLHALEVARPAQTTVRARFDLTSRPSTRRWARAERERLDVVGARCAIYELHGDLVFGAVERVISDAVGASDDLDFIVVDLTRSSPLDAAAQRRFAALAAACTQADKTLVLATSSALEPIADARTFHGLDDALQWCEWQLLRCDAQVPLAAVAFAAHPITASLTDAQCATLAAVGERTAFRAGTLLMSTAAAHAPALWLVLAGEVRLRTDGQTSALVPPGGVFGRVAGLSERAASVDAVAMLDGEAWTCSADALDRLQADDPALAAHLWRALLGAAQEQLVRLARQVAAHA
jgi:glutaminase